MAEYAALTGPNSIMGTLQLLASQLMNFLQTPAGMVFAGMGILAIYFLQKR